MLNKKIIVGLIAVILAFVGIFTFAQNGDDNNNKNNTKEENKDKDEKDDEENNPTDEDENQIIPVVYVDRTAPVITILGDNPTVIEVGTTYTDAGARARDNRDGYITSRIRVVSTVDSTKVGDYTVTYTVRDNAGNRGTAVRTVKVVDTTKPVIKLVGDNPKEVELDTLYVDEGYTVSDNYDTDLQGKVVVDTSAVDTTELGTYLVIYNVTDANNNKAEEVTRTVKVVDTKDPVITIRGFNPLVINPSFVYFDFGATATDNHDGDITKNIKKTSNVKPYAIGEYTVTYTVEDSSGNTATATRNVTVRDNMYPWIIFSDNGDRDYRKTHSTFVTVLDNYNVDEDSLKYQWTNSTEEPTEESFTLTFKNFRTITSPSGYEGKWYLWILAKDTSGNTIIKRTNAFYFDNTTPSITLKGDNPTTIVLGQYYFEKGATATDNVDSHVTYRITGYVNRHVVGTYTLTYTAKDDAGNTATTTRTVIVRDNLKPVITLNGISPTKVEVNTQYQDAGATATDNVDGDISNKVVVTNNVNTSVLGTYYVYYNVIDSSNNAAIEVVRTVIVEDITAPTITLNGEESITIQVDKNNANKYTELGALLEDNYDEDKDVTEILYQKEISSMVYETVTSINTSILSNYRVIYSGKDSNDLSAIDKIRTINVIDTTLPAITLNGASSITLEYGETYTDQGAVVSDNLDSDRTIYPDLNTVDPLVAGKYSLTYNATDSNGNAAVVAQRVVYVRPLITAPPNYSIDLGTTYVAEKATVKLSPAISVEIDPAGIVNPNTVGDYVTTYNYILDFGKGESVSATPKTTIVTVKQNDIQGPSVTFSPNSDVDENNQKYITVTVTDPSGVNAGSLRYKLSHSNAETQTESWFGNSSNGENIKDSFTSGTPIHLDLNGDNDTYYLWILAKDSLGNPTIKKSGPIKNEENHGPTITYNYQKTGSQNTDINYVTITDVSGVNQNSLKYLWTDEGNEYKIDDRMDDFISFDINSTGDSINIPKQPSSGGNDYLWIYAVDIYGNDNLDRSLKIQ